MAPSRTDDATTSSCPNRFSRSLKRCLPRLILILAYVFYLLVGGLVFSLTESPRYRELSEEEHAKMTHTEEERERILESFKNVSAGAVPDLVEIKALLEDLAKAIEHPGLTEGPRNQTVEIGEEWSFCNAMLFCMTTITTIGYGHLVPHTFLGKFLCMIYSGFGIPLTFLLLADLGRLSAIALMKTLNKCFARCCKCCRRKRGLERQNNIHRKSHEPDHDGEGAHSGGSGGIEANGAESNDHVLDLTEATAGTADAPENERLKNKDGDDDDTVVVSHSDHHKHELTDEELLDNVPFFVAPVVFWSYIIFGAPTFIMFEGWSFMESVYFLYFSVTTVGFGDFVPMASIGLVAAWFGLLITATCVFLMYRNVLRIATRVLAFLNSMINKDYTRQRDDRYSNIQE